MNDGGDVENPTGPKNWKFGAGDPVVVARAVLPRAGPCRWLHEAADSGDRCSPRIRPRPPRTVESGDVGLQQGAYDRRHQADEQSLSVRRRETGPNRNWKFWQEPHLPGTIDQQSAPGKVERSAR